MNLSLGVIIFVILLLLPVALLIWKRNDRAMLKRLHKSENRAMDRFIWYS